MPVLGDNEVVFRKLEAGQGIDATGNDLGNASRRKRMTGGFVLRKRRCQCYWVIEIRIAAASQVFLGLCCIAIIQRELAKMIVNFAQPCRMRCFVCVLETPSQFLPCSVSLPKITRKLGMHDGGNPVHDEDLSA